jgi:hypothetical protein
MGRPRPQAVHVHGPSASTGRPPPRGVRVHGASASMGATDVDLSRRGQNNPRPVMDEHPWATLGPRLPAPRWLPAPGSHRRADSRPPKRPMLKQPCCSTSHPAVLAQHVKPTGPRAGRGEPSEQVPLPQPARQVGRLWVAHGVQSPEAERHRPGRSAESLQSHLLSQVGRRRAINRNKKRPSRHAREPKAA